ncbi:endothelin-converting enzyme 1-like [Haematobia irritans]|uniref:endothelin-converting enzyme 1-like n=1 Tax=Haematobia irritans TaxID=7368 RepID=UPI003F4FECEC
MLGKILEILISLILWLSMGGTFAIDPELGAARISKSQEILKYMNQSINPCENFFEFACGNWKTHHPSNIFITKTSAINLALKDFSTKLPQLLGRPNVGDTEAEHKMKEFYRSCRTSGPLEKHAIKLKEIVEDIVKMPALEGDSWQKDTFDWLATVAEISYKYGINIILGYEVKLNIKDHSAYDIWITKQKFPEGYSQPLVGQLKNYLGMEESKAAMVALEFQTFETILKNFLFGQVLSEISVEDLHQQYYPDLNIKKFLNISLGFEASGGMVFYERAFLDFVRQMVKTFSQKALANYIYISLFREFMRELPAHSLVAPSFCLQKVQENFKDVISYAFYRKFNLTQVEEDFTHVWLDIKATFRNLLESNNLKWFNDQAREYALEKLHWLKMIVPSYKQVDLTTQYSNLSVSLQHIFLENVQSLLSFTAAKRRNSLTQFAHHIDDGLTMGTIIYVPNSNAIVVPVSVLLNEYFYSKSNPKALNMARLGYILGHEVIHGFSGIGRKFNKLGNFVGNWDANIENEFQQRRLCLYHQYRSYSFGGLPLPQDLGQAENAADIAGILLAYQSYRNWYMSEQRPSLEEVSMESLPDLGYTKDQLFFIYYAQTWCADTFENARSKIAIGDKHSPDEFRSFVPLTNIADFSNVFQCPLGSAMNPLQKCKIFD